LADIAAFWQRPMHDSEISIVNKETPMNWDHMQGDWMQFKSKVRMNWAKLTDEDLTRIGGRREVLARCLQARYGFARTEAERKIDAWMKTQRYAA
jgi:uncharacterized protein YjbJ (UPF0337 family)